MMWRVACAVACVLYSMTLQGCAGSSTEGSATASLANGIFGGRPTFGADQQLTREEAIIARAIAAHEMRHP